MVSSNLGTAHPREHGFIAALQCDFACMVGGFAPRVLPLHLGRTLLCKSHTVCCHVGSTDGSETGSDEGSPLGPKGGGTLKTCAICLEDYRHGFGYVCSDACACCARDDLIA